MILTTKSTMSFKLPEEYSIAAKFKESHPEYTEDITSEFWNFSVSISRNIDFEIKGVSDE